MIEGEFTGRLNCGLRHYVVISVPNKFSINFLKLSFHFMSVSHMS